MVRRAHAYTNEMSEDSAAAVATTKGPHATEEPRVVKETQVVTGTRERMAPGKYGYKNDADYSDEDS